MHPFFTAHYAGDRRTRLQRTTTRLVRSAQLTSVGRLHVRALDPTDIRHLDALYNELSPRSRFLRFMAPIATVPAAMLEHLAAIDHDRHEAIGAFDRSGLVRSADWFRREDDPGCAELATEVADRYQRRVSGRDFSAHSGRMRVPVASPCSTPHCSARTPARERCFAAPAGRWSRHRWP